MSSFIKRSNTYMGILLKDMPTDFPEFMKAAEKGRAEPLSSFSETPLVFGDDQPNSFNSGVGLIPYRGQDSAKRNLMLEIQSLYRRSQTERFKTLLVGPAGLGKTTLGRIVAKLLQERRQEAGIPKGTYVEIMPAQIASKEKLDAFFAWAVQDPYRIVLIDEVHTLTDLEPWFPVLHDTGDPYYPMANGQRLEIPKTMCWITMTTDPGELDKRADGAMRRRLHPEIELEEPSKADLASIVVDQGRVHGPPVTEDAAVAVARRSMFPWQAKMVLKKAQQVASLENASTLTEIHAQEAFDILALDANGLLSRDRNVIKALLYAPYKLASGIMRYRMSEEALCSAAGVDRLTYKKRVQPKLIRLGMMTTVGGQSLTDHAVGTYGWLRTA
jgi:Holliday junction resolvasome RuvABC ATP-dependent DNA helicase subunit